jgi:serine/arginine repetitive matrix protein 2
VEHANFEFTLGLEVRRDPHIIQMLHNNVPKLPLPPKPLDSDAASTTSGIRNGGFRNLFASPRKGSKPPRAMAAETMPSSRPISQETNIGHYFPPGEAVVGKTHIAFKPIAKNCDSRLLEIRYPMFGALRHQASVTPAPVSKGDRPASQPPSGSSANPSPAIRKQVCKITLQIFRLPPLPGLDQDQLPQSIDECLRGMRHHAWHEHEYHEGLLTQKGGDSNVSVGGLTVRRVTPK